MTPSKVIMAQHLFTGEKLSFATPTPEIVTKHNAKLINAKYAKGEVRIVTEQARYPLNTIVSMVESDNYKLNPDFQRRHRWPVNKQSKLMESLIMNVPIPPIFLYEESYSHYEVMDGLQRLTAIHDFYRDKFALVDLREWRELNGLRYSELPDQVRKGIDRRYLSSIILLQETAKTPEDAQKLKQLVFERINSGGVHLEYQEARNAMYDGPLNRLCIKLSRNQYFCRMWGIPEPDEEEIINKNYSAEVLENDSFRRMEDVELVLRFFAYRQRLENDRMSLTDYLDGYLRQGNLFPQTLLDELGSLFSRTVELVYDVLGETAFWLYRVRGTSWGWYSRPTRVLFEPVTYTFSNHLDSAERLRSQGESIRQKLPQFYQNNYETFGGRQVNRSEIIARNVAFEQFISSFI